MSMRAWPWVHRHSTPCTSAAGARQARSVLRASRASRRSALLQAAALRGRTAVPSSSAAKQPQQQGGPWSLAAGPVGE